VSAIEERRQRAMDVGEDADDCPQYTYRSIETAIREATTVRITPEIITAAGLHPKSVDILYRAFAAAGFQVIQ
jgi:hypothetical protein